MLFFCDSSSGQTIREARALGGHRHAVHALSFSPDGKVLASGSTGFTSVDSSGDLILYQIENQKQIFHHQLKCGSYTIAFAPDGKALATGSLRGCVTIWDLGRRKATKCLKVPFRVYSLTYSADGSTLVVGSGSGGIIYAYNAKTLNLKWCYLFRRCDDLNYSVVSLALSRNGKCLAAAAGNMIVLMDPKTGRVITFLDNEGLISSVALSADGSRLAVGSTDEFVPLKIWDVGLRKVVLEIRVNSFALAFIPDNSKLVASSASTRVSVFDISNGQATAVLAGHDPRDRRRGGAIRTLALTPDGRRLAAGGVDETIMLWNIKK